MFEKIDNKLSKYIKKIWLLQIIYLLLGIVVCVLLINFFQEEIYNAITTIFVIDVSSTERKNLNLKERPDFYNTITTITRANVCGFIAPLLYILIFGNWVAIMYTLTYNLSFNKEYKVLIKVCTILTIIPSLVLQLLLYITYVIKNRKFHIDFKGEYMGSLVTTPLLNADILAAYLESINFYYYFKIKDIDYIKSYGKFNRNIEYSHIKNYLEISYFIYLISFLIFFISFIVFKTH